MADLAVACASNSFASCLVGRSSPRRPRLCVCMYCVRVGKGISSSCCLGVFQFFAVRGFAAAPQGINHSIGSADRAPPGRSVIPPRALIGRQAPTLRA